ncbi:MAG TPA: DNA polymerase III subunit beta [Rickettsiales bacterium]|nr:DNA polymerase III subunit beta [Rickettsiales bacterium]
MDKKFTIEAKKLKNIVLFNPEVGPDDLSNTESSVFIKVSDGKLLFEILSFRYLLIGKEALETKENIEMILPLKRLQDIIKSFDDNVKITFKEEKEGLISVEADGIKFKIKTCEQEGRNQIGDDRGEEYKVQRDELLESMKKVKIAMGDDEVRYYLNGIHIEVYADKKGNHHTFMVATNGHILATYGEKKDEYKLLQKAIMPKKVIPEIIKILEKGENEVSISFSKNKMDIKTENLEILLKLVEGEFPDYEKVIPYNNSKEVKINNNALKDVLGKVCIVSNDKTKNVKIAIQSKNIDLEISSSDGSMAKADIKTDYSGEDINTTLNAKYLLDILGQINEENLVFKIEDGSSPLLIQQENNKNLLFVLMPIRS